MPESGGQMLILEWEAFLPELQCIKLQRDTTAFLRDLKAGQVAAGLSAPKNSMFGGQSGV